ncbi:hypothetical protein DB30_06213 [Enhygromyxa salina]|uniref:Uncharacterized protein n=1 Tax=Enhygromyxa salina TaxID=215803 RepID=A0A0C2CUW1_9BACT|nr:hypothetical protein DB30_06213 [Enhygromyxa salina]
MMLSLLVTPLIFGGGCKNDDVAEEGTTDTTGDGDGDPSGDGDGDPTGDGDGDPATTGDGDGDGDGDPTGDGDGDPPDPIVYSDAAVEDYTRVDRMGMPAVNTALIMSKDEYNAANPTDDVALDFGPEVIASLTGLHAALDDDLLGVMLTPCAPNQCLNQASPLVIPDTLKIDLDDDDTFPNGRALTDPVMDVTLGLIMLNLMVHEVTTLVGVLNPTENDVPFEADFPYLAPPH